MTKIDAVYEFVADCIKQTLEVDYLVLFELSEWTSLIEDKDIEVSVTSSKSIEIEFAGETYTVKIAKK